MFTLLPNVDFVGRFRAACQAQGERRLVIPRVESESMLFGKPACSRIKAAAGFFRITR
jgi:hypothetical protein